MDAKITTITTTPAQTVSKGQIEALKGAVRALAEARPEGMDKGQRCAQISRELCEAFGVANLASIPASDFPDAMEALADLAKPVRMYGPAEDRLRTAKARLDTALADLMRAKRGIADFRQEVSASLLVPLKDALGVSGRGNDEAIVQDGMGVLLAMPLLEMEYDLDRMHEWLLTLATRLPAIGKALDERKPMPALAPAMGAD